MNTSVRVRPEADAADVHQVAGAGEQRDQLAVPVKHGVVMTKSLRWPVPIQGSLVM